MTAFCECCALEVKFPALQRLLAPHMSRVFLRLLVVILLWI